MIKLGVSINIYADESGGNDDDFYFLSLVFVSPKSEEFWADKIEKILQKNNVSEIHGKNLPGDTEMQKASFSILNILKSRFQKKDFQNFPLSYLIIGIKRDKNKEIKYFGMKERESNLHRKHSRSAIKYALKKFCNMSEDNQINLFHFFHDINTKLEKNELLTSDWMLNKIVQDCDFCLEKYSDKIEFISSKKDESNKCASYLIQIADLLAWLTQRSYKGIPDSNRMNSYEMRLIFDFWKKNFLPIFFYENWNDIQNQIQEREIQQEIYQKWNMCHLSFFPDENGNFYRPSVNEFRFS